MALGTRSFAWVATAGAVFACLLFVHVGEAPAQEPRRVEIRDTEMRFLKSKDVGETYEIDISYPKDYHRDMKGNSPRRAGP